MLCALPATTHGYYYLRKNKQTLLKSYLYAKQRTDYLFWLNTMSFKCVHNT